MWFHGSRTRQAVLTSAARHLGGYELQQLREIFESVDGNGDGAISKQVGVAFENYLS